LPKNFFLRRTGIPALGAATLCVSIQAAYVESPYYFYQRTQYLESISIPGAWWANPSLLSRTHHQTFLSANVAPLGRQHLIASARFLLPLTPEATAGIGILGAGPYRNSSRTSANSGGLSTSGSFEFSHPQIQLGAASRAGALGEVGGMIFMRTEQYEAYVGPVWGVSTGWMSPALMERAAISVAFLFTRYPVSPPWWERSGKLGLWLGKPDSSIAGTVEISFTPGHSFGVWSHDAAAPYETVKTTAIVRATETLRALIGISSDLDRFNQDRNSERNYDDNGNCLHLGAELVRHEETPYLGGADLGISVTYWSVFLRLWFGIELRPPPRQSAAG